MDVKQAKNNLVASLFQLSTAATEAATATVKLYKFAGVEGGDEASRALLELGKTVSDAVQSASTTLSSEAVKILAKGAAAAAPIEPQKKKRRVERDPDAPKKPLTTYLRFNIAVREDLKKQNIGGKDSNITPTEVNKIIADKWANLSHIEMAELQAAFDADNEKYKKEIEAYRQRKAAGSNGDASPEKPPVKEADETSPPKKAKVTAPAPEAEKPPTVSADSAIESPSQEKKKKISKKVSSTVSEKHGDGPASPIKKKKKKSSEDKSGEKHSEEKKQKKKKSE